jgi:transposase-like protein
MCKFNSSEANYEVSTSEKLNKHTQIQNNAVSSSQLLPVIRKLERSKALFVSRFSHEVTADEFF